jgi:HlyD family secretion protein
MKHALSDKSRPERLSSPEQLDELIHITAARHWLALLAVGGLLGMGLLWSLFATIPTTVTGTGVLYPTDDATSGLQAVVFVSVDDARKIDAGMPARLDLASVKKDEFGLLQGQVTSANEFPSNQQEMMRVLDNDAFVQSLTAAGALVKVQIALLRDPTTATGYQWSFKTGPPGHLETGMLCSATITIAEQRPIDLLSP